MFAYLEVKLVLKLSSNIGVGNSFEHVGALKSTDEERMWVKDILRVDDDADERLPSIDESQARETD